MPYLLKENDDYCHIDKKRTVSKTKDINKAAMFDTEENAQKMLDRCSKKLKGFEVIYSNEIEIKPELTKEKRRTFTTNERTMVYNKTKGRCAICGSFVSFDEFTVDHIIPLSKGGTNDLKNLQCACKTCNLVKQDILPEDLMDKLTQIMFYQMKKNYNKVIWKKMKILHKKYVRYKIRKIVKIFKNN